MECEHHLVFVNIKTGKVECFKCGQIIEKPVGRAKTFSDIIKGDKDK